ncbi:MAG: FtsX-like permease family protein, partial [Cyclobacteriaceae bacterium]
IHHVDPAFLEVFTFPLKWGLSNSLKSNSSIILSEKMSQKYFGDENPVGQTLKLLFGLERSKMFEITGVAEAFPDARIIDFDFLVNIENVSYANPDYNFNNWTEEIDATLILVKNEADLATIKSGMSKYKEVQNGIDADWPIQDFDFVSINDLHLASGRIRNDISYDATLEGRISLPIIAGFLLVLACFNYINIAIVSGAKRLKEIGLRKVIGANRRSIIVQFFSENLMLTALAALLGFVLAATLFLPWFASFAPVTDQFDLLDPTMWSFLIAILFLTAIFSGLYPAFYISRFQAVQIFSGKLKFGNKNLLTKVFLTLQLALTCVGIAFAIIMAQNSNYQMDRSWGYNPKQILYQYVGDASAFAKLEKKLLEHPEVLSVMGSAHHFSRSQSPITVHLPHTQLSVKELSIGEGYLENMGVSLKGGRWLQQDGRGDLDKILINEKMAQILDFQNPIGQSIKITEQSYDIVGVVRDVHFNDFYSDISPTIFSVTEKKDIRYLTIKFKEGSKHEVYQALKDYNTELFPEMPFLGGFQEDVWTGFYNQLKVQSTFSKVIALLFILLSSLGLYGLIQLNLAGRAKEFSVRKTLGASNLHLAFKILQQYAAIFIISVVLGAPLGYMLNDLLLDMMYPGPRPSGLSGSVLAAFLLIFILIAVMLTQINKVIKANPVEGLKTE